MTAKTIRNVHGILSGAFATAKRWEWIAWNPAESAVWQETDCPRHAQIPRQHDWLASVFRRL